jgi:hypothetical protein
MHFTFKKGIAMHWRRGVVVIVSAVTTEDQRFESRQGVVKLKGFYTLQCCSL